MDVVIWDAFFDHWKTAYVQNAFPPETKVLQVLKSAFNHSNKGLTPAKFARHMSTFIHRVLPIYEKGSPVEQKKMYIVAAPWPAPTTYRLTSDNKLTPTHTIFDYYINLGKTQETHVLQFDFKDSTKSSDKEVCDCVFQIVFEAPDTPESDGRVQPPQNAKTFYSVQLDAYLSFDETWLRYPFSTIINESLFPPVYATHEFIYSRWTPSDSLGNDDALKKRLTSAWIDPLYFGGKTYYSTFNSDFTAGRTTSESPFPMGRALYEEHYTATPGVATFVDAVTRSMKTSADYRAHRIICQSLLTLKIPHAFLYAHLSLHQWVNLDSDVFSHSDSKLDEYEKLLKQSLSADGSVSSFPDGVPAECIGAYNKLKETANAAKVFATPHLCVKTQTEGRDAQNWQTGLTTPNGGTVADENVVKKFLLQSDALCLWGFVPFMPVTPVTRTTRRNQFQHVALVPSNSNSAHPVPLSVFEKLMILHRLFAATDIAIPAALSNEEYETNTTSVQQALKFDGLKLGHFASENQSCALWFLDLCRKEDEPLKYMCAASLYRTLLRSDSSIVHRLATKNSSTSAPFHNFTPTCLYLLAAFAVRPPSEHRDALMRDIKITVGNTLPLFLETTCPLEDVDKLINRICNNMPPTHRIDCLNQQFSDAMQQAIVSQCVRYLCSTRIGNRSSANVHAYQFYLTRKVLTTVCDIPSEESEDGLVNALVSRNERNLLVVHLFYRSGSLVSRYLFQVFDDWSFDWPNVDVSRLKCLTVRGGLYSFDATSGFLEPLGDGAERERVASAYTRLAALQNAFTSEYALFERIDRNPQASVHQRNYVNTTNNQLITDGLSTVKRVFGTVDWKLALADYTRRNGDSTATTRYHFYNLYKAISSNNASNETCRDTLIRASDLVCMRDAYSNASLLKDDDIVTYIYTYVYTLLFSGNSSSYTPVSVADVHISNPNALAKHLRCRLHTFRSVAQLLGATLNYVRDYLRGSLRLPESWGVRLPATGGEVLYGFVWEARARYRSHHSESDKRIATAFALHSPRCALLSPLSDTDRLNLCSVFYKGSQLSLR